MKLRTQYYKMVLATFEKYDFNVLPCTDQKTIILSNTYDRKISIPRRTIEHIIQREDLELYVEYIEPFQVIGWKVILL